MTSSQCFLPPIVGVDGELMLKNSLSPKILEHLTLLTNAALFCLSQGEISTEYESTCKMKTHPLPVAWVMTSKGWPSSVWGALMSFLEEYLAD